MYLYKLIIVVAMVWLLMAGLTTAETFNQVTASDGVVYELKAPGVQKLAPGETRRIGEVCETVRTGWLTEQETCRWQQQVVASADGLTTEPSGTETLKQAIEARVVVLFGLGLMVLAVGLFSLSERLVFVTAFATVIIALAFVATAFATISAAVVTVFAITTSFFTFAAAFTTIATFATTFATAHVINDDVEMGQVFYRFSAVYVALMTLAFFGT